MNLLSTLMGKLPSFSSPVRTKTKEQKILDEFSRELDLVEKQYPMMHSYERIDPYVREFQQANVNFSFIIYHVESKAWFDNDYADGVLLNASQYSLVREGDTVFDLGCNSGFLTTWFSLQAGPKGKVLAFDPFPWNTLATLYSAKMNGMENVSVHTVGVAGKHSEVRIPICDSKIYENAAVHDSYCFNAKLVPLDDFADYRPNFIKVDIEGAERELLSGCKKILSQKPRPQWLFEVHHQFIRDAGSDPDQIGRDLLKLGYTVRMGDAKTGPEFTNETQSYEGCAFWALDRDA